MQIHIGGQWRQGSLLTKHPAQGEWLVPKDAFIKQQGQWSPFKHVSTIRTNDIYDLVANGNEWINHPQRGWYRDIPPPVQDQYVAIPITFNRTILDNLRKVSITFTGYYNTPVDGLNLNYLRLHLNDGTIYLLGTNDAWTDDSTGQNIYKGDAGTESKVMRDVINERYSFTVPINLKVVKLDLFSSPAFTQNRHYPSSLRGMKDFEFTLQH